jgi:hypothetical protein
MNRLLDSAVLIKVPLDPETDGAHAYLGQLPVN